MLCILPALLATVVVIVAQFVRGMAFALVVHNLTFGQGLIRTTMLVPIFMNPAVAAFMWRFILHPDLGIMNFFLLVVRIVPRISLVLPFYVILSQIAMLNTKTALILSGPESRTLPVMVSGFETDRASAGRSSARPPSRSCCRSSRSHCSSSATS